MLEKYKDNEKVRSISGAIFPFRMPKDYPYDYTYGPLSGIWGWATWRRTWEGFDLNMSDWPDFKKTGQLLKQ